MRFWALLVLCTLLAGAARAEEAPLSLGEAVRMALDSLPQLSAARLRVTSAEQGVSVVRGRYAPVTRAQAGVVLATQTSPVFVSATDTRYPQQRSQSLSATATTSLTLYDFGARRHALRAAKQETNLARADLSGAELEAALAVVEAYLTVQRDERRVADAGLSVSIQERQTATIARLVERKARPEVDLQRAQIQLQAARDNVLVLEAETRRDRVELALALGVQSVEGVPLAELGDDALAVELGPERAAREALAQRPELSQARAFAEARRESAREAGSVLAPRLSVDGSVAYTHVLGARYDTPQYGSPRTFDTLQGSAGLFVTWEGLDPSAWANRRARSAEADAAAADVRAVEREVRARALASLEERQRALALVERARHLREGTQAALDAQQKRYELGAGSLLELLDAQALEQGARAQLIDAELGQELAQARVLASLGLLRERVLGAGR